MTQPPLHELGAIDALRAFRDGSLTPVALLAAVTDRLRLLDRETGNPDTEIAAVTQVLESAGDAAERATARYAAGDVTDPLGTGVTALLGLPVATKEKHGIAGERLSQGISAHRDRIAAHDHPVIERITAAGGVIHARTTSPELSCATITHSPLWGVTRNPWNPSWSPGGSSGGAGAALAAGYAPLATASDIAGSTRIPAAFCGVVGYKAPYGRVPGLPPLAADWYRGDGPMARSVADTALLANVMTGVHPADHTTVPGTGPLPIEYPDAAAWLTGKRIGVAVNWTGYTVHPDVLLATTALAARLAAAGADVIEVVLPWSSDRIRDITMGHFGAILAPGMRTVTEGLTDLAPYTEQFMRDAEAAFARLSLSDGLAAEAEVQAELATAMAGCDVLITPVNAVTGLVADGAYLTGLRVDGQELAGQGDTVLDHYWEGHLTVPFNVNNRCPVLAVPAGIAGNGVPIGVQIVGHPYDEHTVFYAGAAIETIQPWPLLAP